MKRILQKLRTLAVGTASVLLLVCFVFLPGRAQAAVKTWSGLGQDNRWSSGPNWVGGVAPNFGGGDSLVFTGTARLGSTNDLTPGLTFTGISFANPAGIFTLGGNALTLGGNISDTQPVSVETIAIPITLSLTPSVTVVSGGVLSLASPISGASFGLNVLGGGQVNLAATNSFGGPVNIGGASTVFISQDRALGAIPGAATPGNVVIDTGSTLSTTNSFTLSTNRGIAVGPTSGSGSGTIDVKSGTTLTYRGIIANNGGTGGLSKLSFGGLTLAGANTYSGPTRILNGTLTLDFTQTNSPVSNIINPVSGLQLGGANAGNGGTNFAALVISPKTNTTHNPTFASTHVTFGGSTIQVTSNNLSVVNLELAGLDHDPGGTLVMVPPKFAGMANGNIHTTTANQNGILGGWATVSGGSNLFGILIGTNLATVDASGNVTNYNGYYVFPTGGTLHGNVNGSSNVIITTSSTGDVIVDADNAFTTNDVNTISQNRNNTTGFTIQIGAGNILRLGKYGTIFKSDAISGTTWAIGESTGGGNGVQNVGILTAGGAPNTAGEILFNLNSTSETAGSCNVECQITDNGTGVVTVVKTGPSSMKLRGHNTYSGGTYVLQGRFQEAGSEIGTANPDAFGTGPVFVLPGCYIFPSGAAGDITNAIFFSGNGTQAEPLGATRGGRYTGPITLIGDVNFGGGATIAGPISGPFSVTLGSAATVNGGATLVNQANSWTGNTIMTARSDTGNNTITLSNNEVIPDGFGKGNVTMIAFGTGTLFWDLNSFNETINGLSTASTGANSFIQNSVSSTTSTLTVGGNDQSGNFGGTMRDNTGSGGILALTKIGAGFQTLSGTNTYTGTTTVSGGSLGLSGGGIIQGSTLIYANGGTFDVSGVSTPFSAPSTVALSNGTFSANAALSTIPNLAMTNSALTLSVDTAVININAGSFTTGGTTNVLNITGVANVTGYPATFTLVKYTGSLGGVGNNFGIGLTPSTSTAGYISNDIANTALVLVLTNGPKNLTWAGNDPISPNLWDFRTTTNWIAFKGFPAQTAAFFDTADQVLFDDTAITNVVNIFGGALNVPLLPGGMLVSNNAINYTFTGPGSIGGLLIGQISVPTTLNKQGSGTVTFANAGPDGYRGGVNVQQGTAIFATDNGISGSTVIANGATLQVGTNGGTGTLPGTTINNNLGGALIFNRGADLNVSQIISGGGLLTKTGDTNTLTLSGANTFTGAVSVVSGTLQAGSGTALGTIAGTTTIGNNAALDVNGQGLGNEPITVQGPGVPGSTNGALFNSGADVNAAVRKITLAGDTTVGASHRWDIRETTTTAGSETTDATLSTSPNGAGYNLTKVGPNQFSLVGAVVDGNLGNISVNQGIFSVQLSTTTLGDNTKTLTTTTNATFDMFNVGATIDKPITLNGQGVFTNLSTSSGTGNSLSGLMTINGSNVWSIGSGQALSVSGDIGGTGNLNLVGAGTLTLNGTRTYPGSTTVKSGKLVFNGSYTGGGTLTNATNTVIAGNGTTTGPAIIGGAVSPADLNNTGTLNLGSTTFFNGAIITNEFLSGGKDRIDVTGNLVLGGITSVQLIPQLHALDTDVGTAVTLINYSGSLTGTTNNLTLLPVPPGYQFSLVDTTTTPNAVKVFVNHVPLTRVWHGGAANGNGVNAWDTTLTTNWYDASGNPPAGTFGVGDIAKFDDGPPTPFTKSVTVFGTNTISDMQFPGTATYTFSGTGRISGLGGMTLGSGALVIFGGTVTNDSTGPMFINQGKLQIGNNNAGGTVGLGAITNNDTLVLARSDSYTISNTISSGILGNGTIQKINSSGIATLTAANTGFKGNVLVDAGILKLLSSSAIGTNDGGIAVAAGATLDIGTNTVNIGVKRITVAGAGVGGNGAIINSAPAPTTFAQPNFAFVTMTNDMVVGGGGRLDWRGADLTGSSTADLKLDPSDSSHPFQLTKVGTNQLQMAGVNIDNNLGHILVKAGMLGIQGPTPSLGNVNSNLVVFGGAQLQFFAVSNAMYKKLVLLDGCNVTNTSASNIWAGPVSLSGSNQFGIGGNWLAISNVISGTGTLALGIGGGGGVLYLPAINTYTGPTYIMAGSLSLTNDPNAAVDGSIGNSSSITISNAVLDVTGRSDKTLTLNSGQTLRGNGTLNGTLVMSSGSTLAPGMGPVFSVSRVLTVTTNATLAGTTIMEVKKGAITNDQLRVSAPNGTIQYGGTLTVTNIGFTLVGGESFRLFSATNITGTFSATNLPPLAPGLSWDTTQLNVSGRISVNGTLSPTTITSFTYNAPNLTLTGTGGNPNGPYIVIGSTNIAAALSTWTPLLTNNFDGAGNFSTPVINVGLTNKLRFFTVQQ